MTQAAGLIAMVILIAGILADAYVITWFFTHRQRVRMAVRRRRAGPWTPAAAATVLVPLALLYAGLLLATQWLTSTLQTTGHTTFLVVISLSSLCFHVLTIGIVIRTAQRCNRNWVDAFELGYTSRIISASMLGYVALLVPVTLAAATTAHLLKSIGVPVVPQQLLILYAEQDTPSWFRMTMILIAMLSAPVAEELLFRGVMLPAMMNITTTPLAIVFTCMVFALLHGNIAAFAPLFVFSVACSCAYVVTGSLRVPVLMHALFNGVNLLIMQFVLNTQPG